MRRKAYCRHFRLSHMPYGPPMSGAYKHVDAIMPSLNRDYNFPLACFVIAKGFPCSSSIPFFVGFLQRLQIYSLFVGVAVVLAALDVRT